MDMKTVKEENAEEEEDDDVPGMDGVLFGSNLLPSAFDFFYMFFCLFLFRSGGEL